MPRKDRSWSQKEWRKRKAEGLCVDCGKATADSPHLRCQPCTSRRRISAAAYQGRLRQNRIAAGMCERCGRVSPEVGFQVCETCRARLKERYFAKFRPLRLAAHKEAHQRLKREVFLAYGGCHCACCGEAAMEFLSIDHLPGTPKSAAKFRRGLPLYAILKRQGYPLGYRVLCMNCNFAMGHFGGCPHARLTV